MNEKQFILALTKLLLAAAIVIVLAALGCSTDLPMVLTAFRLL